MAKINKYWGLVALGAVTAAAAGAMAAVIMKKRSFEEDFDIEDDDDFEEDFDIPAEAYRKNTHQAIQTQWG